jgi:AraC-like DNA-binding protein
MLPPFMETVIEYRLNYAAQQLVKTDLPVTAICYDSGFGDVSHFNKMFKERAHLSPLNYRKKFTEMMRAEVAG